MPCRQLVIAIVVACATMMTASARGDLFSHPSSWTTSDARVNDPPGGRGGYQGLVFDGRYLYSVPNADEAGRHPHRATNRKEIRLGKTPENRGGFKFPLLLFTRNASLRIRARALTHYVIRINQGISIIFCHELNKSRLLGN